ncbi:MAG: HNH endonuclease [Candidatus Diapherotrites archaeon]
MPKFEIDFLEDYSQKTLISELKRIQKIVGDRSVTKFDIDRYSKAGWTTYFKKFGSFSKAILAAGLKPSRMPIHTENSEMISTVVSLWTKTLENEGRRPMASDLKKYGTPYSQDTYRRRFGSWKKVLIKAYNSINLNDKPPVEEIPKVTPNLDIQTNSRQEISVRKRFLVFKRDQFTCVMCRRSGIGIKLEVDHKLPVSKGGTNSMDNLQTLCFECNRGKRADLEG